MPGINQQPEIKICSMAFEENRVESYKDWPFPDSAKCSKLNMAIAGFFHLAGNTDVDSDAAECFFCAKQLDGWEEDDDPWLEHQKHAKYCKFAERKTRQSDLIVEDFLLFFHKAIETRMEKEYGDKVEKFDERYAKLKQIMVKREKL